MSYFGKFYLTGPDAKKAADWLFTADVNKAPGKSPHEKVGLSVFCFVRHADKLCIFIQSSHASNSISSFIVLQALQCTPAC